MLMIAQAIRDHLLRLHPWLVAPTIWKRLHHPIEYRAALVVLLANSLLPRGNPCRRCHRPEATSGRLNSTSLVEKPPAISTSLSSNAVPALCSELPCSDAVTLAFYPSLWDIHFHRPPPPSNESQHSGQMPLTSINLSFHMLSISSLCNQKNHLR